MHSVADVYTFLSTHRVVKKHPESAYLAALFAYLATTASQQDQAPPQPKSVLAFL
jgi:hypothetical protein